MADSKMSLKLLIDTKSQKVLFAEAGKSIVDSLFYILSLPVGTAIRLLSKQRMVGCLANLYTSVENLNKTYIQPNQTKDTLLKPRPPAGVAALIPMLSLTDCEPKAFYKCGTNRCLYVAEIPGVICPQCGNTMSMKMTQVASPPVKVPTGGDNEGGFVKGVVTYMVMDDLVVEPMSTISSIALIA